MELDPGQLIIIGLVASVLTQVLKFVFSQFGWRPGGIVQTLLLSAVAVALALAFQLPNLPPFEDPLQFVGALLDAASATVGGAVVIYKLLLEKVVFPAVRLA